MSYHKDKFWWLLNYIKVKSPELKINIYKRASLYKNEDTSGVCDFFRKTISIALDKSNWEWNIIVLAHEYNHYLISKKRGAKAEKKITKNYHLFDRQSVSKEKREKYSCQVAHEEYLTDINAAKFLDKLDIKYNKKEFWLRANSYMMTIKFFNKVVDVKSIFDKIYGSKKLSLKQVIKPLSKKDKERIKALLNE